ncbi:MAG: hypothetical protein LBI48_00670 [Burkholderiaceae bacterium]|jgi:hypothetical protein|nr:hypothetical protein [Burkholderiaceae bacterium]
MRTAFDLAADLLPVLPGVPQPRLERALLRAAQELCRTSRCWTVWTDPVTVAGSGEYDVELPPGAQVAVVERMTVDGRPRPMLPFSFTRRAPDDMPGAHVVPGRLTFQVTDGIHDGAQIRFRVALAPYDKAQGVDEAVFDPHSSVLAAGICALLLADPGQPWSNPGLAQVYAAQFSSGVARARLAAWRGMTDSAPRPRITWC